MPTLYGPDKRKSSAHRLAIIEGHLRKVRRMIEQGDECLKILHQSRAIQQALRKFDTRVMEQHLRICLARGLRQESGGLSEPNIQALLSTFNRF